MTNAHTARAWSLEKLGDTAAVAKVADAAVVGSAIVSRLAKGLDAEGKAPEGLVEDVLGFVRELATGVRGARG